MDPSNTNPTPTPHQKAEAFTLSYKKAMELSLDPSISLTACAEALASHYGPKFYSFTFGSVTVMPDDFPEGTTHKDIVAGHLTAFLTSHLGYRITLHSHTIHAYTPTSAQCWLTWEIEPQNGVAGWRWTNIYGYREMPDGREWWESCVSDGEVGELMKRVPGFFGKG